MKNLNKKKVRQLYKVLTKTGDEKLETFGDLDRGISMLTSKVKRKIELQTLGSVNERLEDFRKNFDFDQVLKAVNDLKGQSGGIYKELASNLEVKLGFLSDRVVNALEKLESVEDKTTEFLNELNSSKEDATKQKNLLSTWVGNYSTSLRESKEAEKQIRSMLKDIDVSFAKFQHESGTKHTSFQTAIDDAKKHLESFRTEILALIASGGGNANRQIRVDGTDYLTKFTDINFVAGSNVTLSAANDVTNKRVDITIASTGSGGASIETPSGTIDGSNTIFTVLNAPSYIVVDGMSRFETENYTYAAGTITITDGAPPVQYIRSFY
jgi:hypothetical protein